MKTDICPTTGRRLDPKWGGTSWCHADDGSMCWGEEGRLISVVPATGWELRRSGKLESTGPVGEEMIDPLALWGVFELCDGSREVHGIDPDGQSRPSDSDTFLCYELLAEDEARRG